MFTVDPTLAFRDFQCLKLKCDKLLSSFAFNCNLRHYTKGGFQLHGEGDDDEVPNIVVGPCNTRPMSQLNLSNSRC